MAISRIGGTTGNAINGGSITLTLPGSMNVNDLIIVAYGAGDDDFTQPTLAMTTADYTELTTSTLSADGGTGGDGNLAVFYKYHNGTDTQAITTASGAGSDSSTAACLQVFRGVATVAQGGPLEIPIQVATGTSGGDPNPPSVSGFTEATSAVVIAAALGSAGALTLTAPTNYTTNALNAVGNDTFDTSVGLAYRLSGASDPEDPGVFTDNGAGVAWCAATMVLKEAPAAVPYSADLTAPAFGVTPQGVTRLNDYVSALSAATVAFTAQSLTRLNDRLNELSAPSFSFTPLDAAWDMITGFTAELTAATFSFTAQAVARFNDYTAQLSAATVSVTAQAMTWLQDTVMVLSASTMGFVAQALAWSDGIPEYIHCIYMPITKAYRRMWRLLNGPYTPYQ